MNRFCSYLWVFEQAHADKTRSAKGFNLIFKMSVALHGKQAQESSVLIDTTVQEKNITYPTDAKLAIKIINRFLKCTNSVALQGIPGI
jgi:IS5 family transposase